MSQIIREPWDYSPRFATDGRLKTLLRQLSKRTKEPKPSTSDPNIFIATLLEYLKDNINAFLYISDYRSVDAILIVLLAQKGKQQFKKWHRLFFDVTQADFLKNRDLLLDYLNIKGVVGLHEYDHLTYSAIILEDPWFKSYATP